MNALPVQNVRLPRSADFLVCRIADIRVGKTSADRQRSKRSSHPQTGKSAIQQTRMSALRHPGAALLSPTPPGAGATPVLRRRAQLGRYRVVRDIRVGKASADRESVEDRTNALPVQNVRLPRSADCPVCRIADIRVGKTSTDPERSKRSSHPQTGKSAIRQTRMSALQGRSSPPVFPLSHECGRPPI